MGRRRLLSGLAAGTLAAALIGAAPAHAADSPWQRVDTPPATPQAALNAVAARAGTDVWAAGHEAARRARRRRDAR